MTYIDFKNLHHRPEILILGNVWDAQSAKIAQDAGFKALGTSSHAIANSMGYEDGEQITVDEILFVVERIVNAVEIPISVDFESGYSNQPEEVAANVKRLVDIGVVGINLEDGQVINGKRMRGEMSTHQQKIEAIKANTNDIFINARTDTFTTNHATALEESIIRAKEYEKAGADGIFVPLIEKQSDLQILLKEINQPLNIFLTPNLPSMETLTNLGVKRLSHGPKIYEWIVGKYSAVLESFVKDPKLPA